MDGISEPLPLISHHVPQKEPNHFRYLKHVKKEVQYNEEDDDLDQLSRICKHINTKIVQGSSTSPRKKEQPFYICDSCQVIVPSVSDCLILSAQPVPSVTNLLTFLRVKYFSNISPQ